ncbi:MAG: septum formation initiator family protein [Paludibacteraceae bacterium]|nr:septum formation initiator family protein [Paludibacteraceae bacterium]
MKKIWHYLKMVLLNKYLLLLVGFGVYISFFDDHNLIDRWQTQRKIRELQKEYEYYQNEIKQNKEKIKLLQNDTEYLERFARENYYMKAKDEDIFIIKE